MAKRGGGKKKAAVKEEDSDFTALLDSTVPKVVDMRDRVSKIMQVYDQSGEKIIDPRDLPVIMYALGLFPKESDLEDIIRIVEEPGTTGLIKTDRLIPYLTKILLECSRFQPPTREQIEAAFRTFDRDKNGLIDPVRLRDALMKEGDPLTKDQADDFLKFAVDEVAHKIRYEDYVDKVLKTRDILASTYAIEHYKKR